MRGCGKMVDDALVIHVAVGLFWRRIFALVNRVVAGPRRICCTARKLAYGVGLLTRDWGEYLLCSAEVAVQRRFLAVSAGRVVARVADAGSTVRASAR